MGLEEKSDAGLDVEDLVNIFGGHIEDRYQVSCLNPPTTFFMSITGVRMTFSVLASQFSPSCPIMPNSPGYRKVATLNDMIHCLVYVVDTSNSSLLTPKMLDEFDAIRRKANRMGERCAAAHTCFSVFRCFSCCRTDSVYTPSPAGIPQILLMTKVDKACSLVAEDLKTVYQSVYIQRKVKVTTSVKTTA